MNNKPRSMTDDELASMLASVLDAAEPIPAAVIDAAYAAVEMDMLTEELAVLAFDSSVAGALVEMRSTEAEVRLLSFVNDHLTVDLELHGDGRTIVGQVSPPTGQPLQVEGEDGSVTEVATDDFGRFRMTAPSGAIRLRAIGLLITPWISR